MKTNLYILLVLLFSFSLGNAQSASPVFENGTTYVISVSNEDKNTISITNNLEVNTNKENESLLIDASSLKASIARSSSDIRIYLIRKRNEGNISLVFPKINKAVKA